MVIKKIENIVLAFSKVKFWIGLMLPFFFIYIPNLRDPSANRCMRMINRRKSNNNVNGFNKKSQRELLGISRESITQSFDLYWNTCKSMSMPMHICVRIFVYTRFRVYRIKFTCVYMYGCVWSSALLSCIEAAVVQYRTLCIYACIRMYC